MTLYVWFLSVRHLHILLLDIQASHYIYHATNRYTYAMPKVYDDDVDEAKVCIVPNHQRMGAWQKMGRHFKVL